MAGTLQHPLAAVGFVVIQLSLDAMPQGVSAGAVHETTITITEQTSSPGTGGGGGGGGGSSGPSPSLLDFEWNAYETVPDTNGRQVPRRFSGSAPSFDDGYPLVGTAILAERCTWSCERASEVFEAWNPWSEPARTT